jgi:hypothetical protein
VIVYCYGKNSFGLFLADNILIEKLLDGLGFGSFLGLQTAFPGFAKPVFGNVLAFENHIAEMHAFVADINPGASDNFLHLFLAFTAKGTADAISLFSVFIIAFEIKQRYSSLNSSILARYAKLRRNEGILGNIVMHTAKAAGRNPPREKPLQPNDHT